LTNPLIADILRQWNLELKVEHPDIRLAGSPERSQFRTVIEDEEGGRFVLEKIDPRIVDRKREIAAAVGFLASRGLAGVHPYLRNRGENFITKAAGGFWQVSPFIEGVELRRPDYTNDSWRGKALARFLIEMKEKSEGIPFGSPGHPFSLSKFLVDLMERMTRHNPEQAAAAQAAYRHLEKHFFPAHNRLPVAFCHGDPHPVNVIWGTDRIQAVVDWEFLGYKPEIYDAALIIGCVGMEDPESLTGPLVKAFIQELQASGCFETSGFAVLPEFVLALRFAWLSEWLRKEDDEMVKMETDYIHLLLNGRDRLRRTWEYRQEVSGRMDAQGNP
jgi:homoserine kinase type II